MTEAKSTVRKHGEADDDAREQEKCQEPKAKHGRPRTTISGSTGGGTRLEFSIVTIGLKFLSEGKQGACFLRFRLKMHACV